MKQDWNLILDLFAVRGPVMQRMFAKNVRKIFFQDVSFTNFSCYQGGRFSITIFSIYFCSFIDEKLSDLAKSYERIRFSELSSWSNFSQNNTVVNS